MKIPAGGATGTWSRRKSGRRTLRLEGEYWAVADDEKVVRVRDAKGLRYLARLVSEAGRPVAAVALAGSVAAPGTIEAEHARVNVTRAIRAVCRKIGRLHPALGADIERHVRTGAFCCYERDDREAPWDVSGNDGPGGSR